MPTLQFKGKNIIWNHHMSVPYHTLEKDDTLGFQEDKANGNLLVEGDNLTALKALLPEFGGRVKCIYIDPPYNTGKEHWVYNDAVNSPMLKEWLGKEVTDEDLTKHDKWLCMMTPRLKLLRELLSDDGFIFVNIDDNEVHHLKCVMNEIFGEEKFIGSIAWKKTSGDNKPDFAFTHDLILIYGKNSNEFPRVPLTKEQLKQYANPDNDPRGKWAKSDYRSKWTKEERPNLYYGIEQPNTKEIIYPDTYSSSSRVWACSEETHLQNVKDNLLWWGDDGLSKEPKKKRFLSEHKGANTRSVWLDAGTNDEASQMLAELFPDNPKIFDTPKPVTLLKRIIAYFGSDAIILDSFAGSGTTGHAVMELNKEDGGNRRFILVQMPENSDKEPDKNICRDITRERLVRAIEKYGYESGFEYWRVGQPLDAQTLLEGQLPPYNTFAKYVYFLATGKHLADEKGIDAKRYFVGSCGNEDIYLIYDDDMATLQTLVLNYDKAEAMRSRSGQKKIIAYAPACFLDEEMLSEMKIEFVSIPYSLFERKSGA